MVIRTANFLPMPPLRRNYLGWGINFFDYDNDGYKDIFAVNRHVMDHINQANQHVIFPQKIYFSEIGLMERLEISATNRFGTREDPPSSHFW